MARTFGLHIWASEKPFYDGECESLVIPSVDGKYGIMAGHSDLITAIVPGELKFTVPGKSPQIAAVSEGIMKIENNNVLVLVETIERPEEIDANRAAAPPSGERGDDAEAKPQGILYHATDSCTGNEQTAGQEPRKPRFGRYGEVTPTGAYASVLFYLQNI